MLTLIGFPVVIQSDLGAQTFRGQVTMSAMAAPTLVVTPKINGGGTLADGTYYYQVQARGGNFYSPRSTEQTCVISGGSGGGSCVLSWTPVAGAITAYIPSGRASSGGEGNFTAVSNQNNTTWTDLGTQVPSGGANASTVPPILWGTLDITKSFVASGASHTSGLVPDPGVTAGTTKFLREDSTWQAPPAPTVMVASGASHAAGSAPDPGATAGTTKFLREDATWQAPPTAAVMVASGASHAAGMAPIPEPLPEQPNFCARMLLGKLQP
jgi:hypothetical protein